jgi:hypothetical protein
VCDDEELGVSTVYEALLSAVHRFGHRPAFGVRRPLGDGRCARFLGLGCVFLLLRGLRAAKRRPRFARARFLVLSLLLVFFFFSLLSNRWRIRPILST